MSLQRCTRMPQGEVNPDAIYGAFHATDALTRVLFCPLAIHRDPASRSSFLEVKRVEQGPPTFQRVATGLARRVLLGRPAGAGALKDKESQDSGVDAS